MEERTELRDDVDAPSALAFVVEDHAELEPAISAEETTAIRDAFEWGDTRALSDTDPDGNVALRYMIVEVTSAEDVEHLDLLGIHWSKIPVFAEERQRWAGQAGVLDTTGDGEGTFVFAVVPAFHYNLLRAAALDGSPIFRVMQHRPVPVADASNSDGSLSYEYLLRNGFQYRPQDGPVSPTTSVNAAFVNLIRAAVESIASAGRDIINGIRDLFGTAGRVTFGSVTLSILAEFQNTDPTFVPGSSLRRAWGIDSSTPIGVPGTPIWAAQGLMTSRDELNVTNGVALDVVAGIDTMLCIDLENDDAFVTTNVLSASVCQDIGAFTADTAITARFRHRFVNTYVIVVDGQAWYQRIGTGAPARRVKVLTGDLADFSSVNNRSYAPCFGGGDAATTEVVFATLFATPVPPEALVGIAVDLVITDADARTRVIPAHEYGHFAFCQMITRADPGRFVGIWSDVIRQTIVGTAFGGGANPPPGAEAAVMNEAVADLIAVQLAGGSNRFLTALGSVGAPALGEVFCLPGNPQCAEDNIGSPTAASPAPPDPFNARVATELTRLHDVFDGAPENPGEVMHNGGVWLVDATGLLTGTVSFVPGDDAGDDQVLLMGGLFSVVDAWVDAPDGLFGLTVVNFYRGVTRQARIEGIGDGTLCAAYALHEPVPGCLLAFFP